ncbi:hypothetical protein E3Q18_02177 [Wallemia mellicola]|nr:hypothetical protein E3Q18_02177 [Wallemia mellicola]TIC05142.1 hypothetical protein E3Q16_02410 [Wallemia mellicola]TIC11288.1 hypothetical protein E3Q14_02334 [Wallemia mellicola]
MELQVDQLKSQQVALGSWAFLFSEIINYNLKRVDGIAELESKLNWLGYRVGQRELELYKFRQEGTAKNPRQHTSLIEIWRSLFGKTADSLEKSKENANEWLGSIGSLLSCKLRLNSCRLNVISRLSRNAEINYKEYNGLEHTIKGFEVHTAESIPPIQQLIIATKASDALPALESVRDKLKEDSSVLFLQNGLGYLNHSKLKTFNQQLLISNTNIAATLVNGKLIESSNGGTFNVTTYTPSQALTKNSEGLLHTLASLNGIDVKMVDNKDFLNTAHLKLVANCSINALGSIHNCKNGDVYQLNKDLVEGVINEASTVLCLDEKSTRDYVLNVLQSTKDNYNSTHRDIYQRGKRASETEIEYINGHILREADLRGINTPYNRYIYDDFMCKFK